MEQFKFARHFFTCATFICLGFPCASVKAQFGELMPPPSTRSFVDSHQIDMLSGAAGIPGMAVGIGSANSGIVSNPGRQRFMHDNFTGTLTSVGPNSLRVDSLGNSDYFQGSGNTYTNVRGTGSSLTCAGIICTYTTRDGTYVEFDQSKPTGFNQSANVNVGQQTKIVKPDGEVITISYLASVPSYNQSHLISAVNSSLGWMLKYYFGPKVTTTSVQNAITTLTTDSTRSIKAINTSVEYCNPNLSHCNNLINAWPTSSMQATQKLIWSQINPSATTTLFSSSVTNPEGKTDFHSDASSNPAVQPVNEGYTTPGGVSYSFYKPGCAWINGSCTTTTIQGKVNQITISGGNIFSYNWPAATGPDGTYSFNVVTSRMNHYIDNLGRKYRYTYADAWGNYIDKVIDPDATPSVDNPTGGYTDYDYDARGNITRVAVYPKNGGTPLVTSATYPTTCSNIKTCNKPLTITTPKGITTTFTYSPDHGGVTSETKPAINGVQTQINYGYSQIRASVYTSATARTQSTPVWRLTSISKCMSMNLATCVGTSNEHRIQYVAPDFNGQPKQIVESTGVAGSGRITHLTYDKYGNLKTSTNSAGTTTYFYDSMQRLTGKIEPDIDANGLAKYQAIRTTYNADGKISIVEKGTTTWSDFSSFVIYESNQTEFGVTGLPIAERYYVNNILERVTQKSYNNKLELECVAERLNKNAFNSLPQSACTLGIAGVDGNDRITKYFYDATGALLKSTSAFGTPQQRDDRVKTFDPANGLLATEADGNGNKTFYKYDNYKRPWKTVYPVSTNGSQESTTDYVQTNYTGASISSVRLRDGQVLNYSSYDALGRLTGVTGAISETFSYNNFSYLTNHTTTLSGTTHSSTYTYNAFGGMLTDARTVSGQSLGTISYDYDASGNRTKLTWPDGIYVTYNYHIPNGSALKSIVASDGITLAIFDYDERARLKYLTRGNGVATTYGYYEDYKMSSLFTDIGGGATADDISESFSYTVGGQLKSRTLNVANQNYIYTPSAAAAINFVPNALNQLATINGVGLGYDRRGNLTCDQLVSGTTCNSLGSSYTYSPQNHLLSSSKSGITTSLGYDAEGRLFSVTKSGSTTRFMHDGDKLIAETDSSNNILRRYVYHPQSDTPIAWFEGGSIGDKRYYTTDRLGSIVGVTLQNGLSTSINAYDDYGIQKNTSIGRFQYTGQAWIPELQLYYYKSRFYSPSLGRFLQTDTVGYLDGMNWYSYAGNDPVNFTDPSGMNACPIEDDPYCIDNPETETGTEKQEPPTPEQEKVEEVLVEGHRNKEMSDGTKLSFPMGGYKEQGFSLSQYGMYPMSFTRSGTSECDDGTSRATNAINIKGLGDTSIGHTHGGGGLDPLPGPEDGIAAAATGNTAYMLSRAGAFGIEKTNVGFRVRQLAGKPLSKRQRAAVSATVAGYNQNNGGSGAKCKFIPSN